MSVVKLYFLLSVIFCFIYWSLPLAHLGGVSLKLISLFVLSAFAVIFSIAFYAREPIRSALRAFFSSPVVWFLCLVFFYTLCMFLFGGYHSADIFLLTERVLLPLAYMFTLTLLIHMIGRDKFVFLIIFSFSLSILVALLQYLDVQQAWDTRFAFGLDTNINYAQSLLTRTDNAGLDLFSIPLSYKILVVVTFIYYLVKRKYFSYRVFPYSLMLLFVFLSTTRSLILAFIAAFMISLKRKIVFFILFVLIIAASIIMPTEWVLTHLDDSAVGRLLLFYSAIKIILNNPLGVGERYFENIYHPPEQLTRFIDSFYQFDIDPSSWVENFTAHNYILNFGVYYGIFGLLILLGYWLLFLKRIRRTDVHDVGKFYFCFIIVHSFFHNGGPFYSDYDFFFIAVFFEFSYFIQVSNNKKMAILSDK